MIQMKLLIVDKAIETCEDHLSKSNARGTEIEAYLTGYLLIFICAKYEEIIEKMIVKRASKANDPHIEAFVSSAVDNVFRSLKTSEIAGLLKRFGPDYKDKFQEKVNGTVAETFFNNIVINRHDTAHNLGSNITLNELIKFYNESHSVLDAIAEVLGI